MTERKLGFTRPVGAAGDGMPLPVSTNTRTSLWPERLPAIALQVCIDKIEAAPPAQQAQVKFDLPCHTCPEASACLNAKAKEMGPLIYGREILTNPASSEATLFPRRLFAPMLERGESLVPFWHPPFSRESEYKICQAWDLAWSERVGGDYLVCETAYVHLPTGLKQLLHIERWQRLSFPDQCKLIEAKHIQYKSDLVVIESDAAQKIWSQHLAEETSVPVLPHAAGSDKQSLANGVPALLISFSNRKWRIPYTPGTYNHQEVENMLKEFEAFQFVDGGLEGVGEHDDTVMCFWHLNWGLDRLLYFAADTNSQRLGHVAGERG